jgi:L-ribulokinase
MCGYVEDGIIPGFFGYEAGQSCVGDHFAWFVENCVPAAYEREAAARGVSIHELLEAKAAQLGAGRAAWWRWTGGTATAACWWMWTSRA